MIAGNKILTHLGNGKRPVTADIYLTDVCNNNCPYCNYTRTQKRSGATITADNFKRYVARLLSLGVQGIILTGGGEPTTSPYFDEITAFLEESNIPYGVNTNFNIYHSCHPVFLKVSLDGFNKESYIRRRGVDAYEKTIENIKRFAENKGESKLGLQMLAIHPADIVPFYEAHKDIDFDYMVFRPIESNNGTYYRFGDFGKRNTEIAETICEIVHKLKDSDPRVTLNYKFDLIGEGCDDCPAHWSQMCVNPKGEVLYCCHKPLEIVGHLMDDNILEEHEKARFNAHTCDIPCRLSGPNKALRELKQITERMFI